MEIIVTGDDGENPSLSIAPTAQSGRVVDRRTVVDGSTLVSRHRLGRQEQEVHVMRDSDE